MFDTTKRYLAILCAGILCLCGCSRANDTHSTGSEYQSNTVTLANSTTATHITTQIATQSSVTTTQTTETIATTGKTTQATTPQPILSGSHRIEAPILAQRPDYLSGCESVSAVMLLQYWGETITVDEFIDNHLAKSTRFYSENGRYYGPSPYEYFIGNPRTEQAYGCMAPTIQNAIDHYYGDDSFTRDVSGFTLAELCDTYISNEQPVLVWVTIGMVETFPGDQWYFEDGTLFSWPVNEHCMMLVGYDSTHYYFNDPYTGKVKKYPHTLCEERYSDLGKQAVTIIK